MKLNALSKILAGTALVISASAVQAITVGFIGQDTYIGDFFAAPLVPNSGSYSRDQTTLGVPFPTGVFNDFFIFTVDPLSPTSTVQASTNFNPTSPLGVLGFGGGLYDVTAATCGAVGTLCTGVTIGSLIIGSTFTPAPGTNPDNIIGSTNLTAGTYAINLFGNNTGGVPGTNQTIYSGQLSFLAEQHTVPEPSTLALMGIAMAGFGYARRRKQG